jgi:hypothetical protein
MKTTQSVQIVDGDFLKSQDLEDFLVENDGSAYLDQWISLSIEGVQYDIDYVLDVTGQITIDNGDRWTPPSVDVLVKKFNLQIKAISSNEEILDLNDDEKMAFQTILKNTI